MLLAILFPDKWSDVFIPATPMFEIFVRGSIIYLFLYFALRGILKRETAGVGISDVLVIVLIADAVQNGMAGTYNSVADALVLALTIIGWDWVLSYIAFRYPRSRWIIRPKRMLLIQEGRLINKSAQRELLTTEEIEGHLHQQGIQNIEDVREAWIESTGAITAIPKRKS